MKVRGFTLIELLVVIGIIGVLATFSVVQIAGSREKARIAKGAAFSNQLLRTMGGDAILRWDLDECTGTAVTDQSETAANGTLINGPAWSTSSPTNQGCSVSFDGTNDYISATNSPSLANRSFTISAWASRRSSGVYHNIVSVGSAGGINQLLHFGFRSGNTFMCAFYGNDLDTITTFTDDDWHHFVCTFDSVTKMRKIYVDGVLSRAVVAAGNFTGTNTVEVGRTYGGSNSFNGLIDDVRIYGETMTSMDVERLYAEGSRRSSVARVE